MTVLAQTRSLGRPWQRGELLDIGSGDPHIWLATQQDGGPHTRVALQPIEQRDELLANAAREGVHTRVRHIERHERYVIALLHRQSWHQTRSTTMAWPIPPAAQTVRRPN